jgi:hypothetical protein
MSQGQSQSNNFEVGETVLRKVTAHGAGGAVPRRLLSTSISSTRERRVSI